eukprot:101238_1
MPAAAAAMRVGSMRGRVVREGSIKRVVDDDDDDDDVDGVDDALLVVVGNTGSADGANAITSTITYEIAKDIIGSSISIVDPVPRDILFYFVSSLI